VKQQQIVVSHAPSVWNVPIQLGVDEIVPFFYENEEKIKSNQSTQKRNI
jgi:hypothetical protein